MSTENNAPSSKRSCATCRFSTLERPQPNLIQTVRVCRRQSPVPVLVQTPGGAGILATFPTVNDALWCHQWTASSDEKTTAL